MNLARRSLGYPYWSLSSLLKTRVKRAVNFINDFELFVARYTKKKNCSGVICGHIHVPIIRKIDGIDYYNCGDWMEHCTALVEHLDGRIELVDHTWLEGLSEPNSEETEQTSDTEIAAQITHDIETTGYIVMFLEQYSLKCNNGESIIVKRHGVISQSASWPTASPILSTGCRKRYFHTAS